MPRTIEYTTRFKKDYKRESRGQLARVLTEDFPVILDALVNDLPLEPRLHDHPLSGEWADFRDLHVRPDLVLIYQKPDAARLILVRLGSHSELFG